MKSLFKLLMVFVGVLVFTNIQAQNTGIAPYVGSTHPYTITKSSIAGTTLAWSVTSGSAGAEFNFIGATDGVTANVEWLVAGTYILQVVETRTDVTPACPTTRQISVTVTANTFDVVTALASAATDCATVSNPVVDISADGNNTDDVFGTTSREYTVSMAGGDPTKTWSFDYAISDIATSDKVTGVLVNGAAALTGTINVPANTASQTITVVYSTNKNTLGTNGQDPDISIALTITNGQDELGTPDSNAANDVATYIVNAVPATTGITTD
ncbi:MAG: hypothetical protein JEZ01_10885 [Labilibaculum sp.]|nr:hypothetical protein [Labilibaculum sp.]MBI9058261.1 hypothetical protein [Labilibaculum sp.]